MIRVSLVTYGVNGYWFRNNRIEWFRMVFLIMEYGFEILVFEEKKSKSKYHKSGFATLSSNSWFLIFDFWKMLLEYFTTQRVFKSPMIVPANK